MGLARAMAHIRFGGQTDAQRVRGSLQQKDSDDSAKPFRLLDLPKEIRLMIYEELDVVYNRHPVPLSRSGGYSTLVNPSLDGVRILQTCHQINEEASCVLRRALKHLSNTPAMMSVDVEYLIALTSLGDYDSFHRNILERILSGTCSYSVQAVIHDYRTGRKSIDDVRERLRVPKSITDQALKALGSFMLRAAHCRKTFPDSKAYPPLRVVIRLFASFVHPSYTITVPRFIRCWYKYIHHVQLRRSRTISASRRRMVEDFACRSAYACGANKLTSISVQLHFPDLADEYADLPSLKQSMESAIARGISRAKPHKERGVLKYEGLYDASNL